MLNITGTRGSKISTNHQVRAQTSFFAQPTADTDELYKSMETRGGLIAAIIKQAREDSMPESDVFDKFNTTTSMFNSLAYNYSDGYMFMSDESRLDLFANLAGLNLDYIKNKWKREYKQWRADTGVNIAKNVIAYMEFLSTATKVTQTISIDLVAFTKSNHTDYWAELAGIDVAEFKEKILTNLKFKTTLVPLAKAA